MYQVLKYSFLGSLVVCVLLAIGMEFNPNLGWPWWAPFAPVVAVVAIIAIVLLYAVIEFLTARNPWQ